MCQHLRKTKYAATGEIEKKRNEEENGKHAQIQTNDLIESEAEQHSSFCMQFCSSIVAMPLKRFHIHKYVPSNV